MGVNPPNRYQLLDQQNNYDITDFVIPPPVLLNEDGSVLLNEDGTRIGLE